MSDTRDEDSRRNDLRRRIAEELIASELRRRRRKRIDEALLDSARDAPADEGAQAPRESDAPDEPEPE
ncbi:MAG TPA: hypothetical protein VFS55_17845 [Dokdonella sp.]|nr:hypothetical protein [Dokdonella sp.]